MGKNLQLIRTDKFGEVEYDIYLDNEEMYMTSEQLGNCLGFSNGRKGIDNIVSRNEYLNDTEFSTTLKLRAVDGKIRDVRVFTEDDIYEVTMLARTDVAKEFRARVRKVLKDIRQGRIVSLSENPCEAAMAKDMIDRWKRHVSNPLVERLNMLLVGCDLVKAYACVYSQMKDDFAFDMNEAKMKYSLKYRLPLNECSVINVIADNKELRKQFIVSAHKCISERAENKVKEARRFKARCGEIVEDVLKFSEKFEDKLLAAENSGCDCFGRLV